MRSQNSSSSSHHAVPYNPFHTSGESGFVSTGFLCPRFRVCTTSGAEMLRVCCMGVTSLQVLMFSGDGNSSSLDGQGVQMKVNVPVSTQRQQQQPQDGDGTEGPQSRVIEIPLAAGCKTIDVSVTGRDAEFVAIIWVAAFSSHCPSSQSTPSHRK